MARLAVTVTVFFFVIALSHARIPADLTENDVTNNDLLADLTESNQKTATNMIFLPTAKSESEPEGVEEKHAVNEPDPDSDSSESKTTTTSSFESVTVINFRPINRQFPRRPSFLFRHRRPCRHHAMRKPWGQGRREVSYGNDMLTTASGGSGDIKAERLRWYRGDGRLKVHQIPARWVNFHDGDVPKFGFRHEADDQLTVMKRPHHDNHGHHHHHHHEEEGEEHEHRGGFLKKIRKFLTHF